LIAPAWTLRLADLQNFSVIKNSIDPGLEIRAELSELTVSQLSWKGMEK
jgi:hypothetical protein